MRSCFPAPAIGTIGAVEGLPSPPGIILQNMCRAPVCLVHSTAHSFTLMYKGLKGAVLTSSTLLQSTEVTLEGSYSASWPPLLAPTHQDDPNRLTEPGGQEQIDLQKRQQVLHCYFCLFWLIKGTIQMFIKASRKRWSLNEGFCNSEKQRGPGG